MSKIECNFVITEEIVNGLSRKIAKGSCRSWKTVKVMEFTNFIFQVQKVIEFNSRSL